MERILSNISGNQSISPVEIEAAADSVLFKHDRIYQHKILRINYTTYDIRRAQDVINPDTSHCNLMVLNGTPKEDDADKDRGDLFLYAKVLAICHANIVYIGPGAVDYQPRRMNFLWVRWYDQIDSGLTGWSARKLDRVRFPSLSGSSKDGSFGFVDPFVVLRACHIIPRFCKGKRYEDGKGMSFCGRDSSDWNEYYINR